MAIPKSFIEELRHRVSLATYAGEKLEWDRKKSKPNRGEYWACCPFHAENTPSFKVDDGKGFYYCFGCQAKGNLFGFVQTMENVGFDEAVRSLARRAGLAVPTASREERQQEERSERLLRANSHASHFYRARLHASSGARARRYLLEERELSKKTIERFEIGFAPDSRNELWMHLQSDDISAADAAEAGLVQRPERGEPYDFFRNRIMFPLTLPGGRCVAFGGRLLGDGQPKYLNSRESPVFRKGRTLYNLGGAREAARRSARIVVVEGYMDVIGLHENGIEDVVAPLGTAFGEEHLNLLWSSAETIVIALDGDEAGQRAATRVIDLALPRLKPGREIRFALLPQGMDPDDYARAHGAEGMEAMLRAALPLAEMAWRRELSGSSTGTPEAIAQAEARLYGLADTIQHQDLRRHYRKDFRNRIWQIRSGGPGAASGAIPVREATRSSALLGGRRTDGEYRRRARAGAILLAVLNHPDTLESFCEDIGALSFEWKDLDRLRDQTISAYMDGALDEEARSRLLRRLRNACRNEPHLSVERCTKPTAAPADVRSGIETLISEHRGEHDSQMTFHTAIDQITSAKPDPEADAIIRQAAAERARRLEAPDDVHIGSARSSEALLELVQHPPWRRGSHQHDGE